MDLTFNRKSIFRKSFRQRHTSSSIHPVAVSFMKSLKKHQSTRRSIKISSSLKILKRTTGSGTTNNTEMEKINFIPGNSCRSPTLSFKLLPINEDAGDDDNLLNSPIFNRRESFYKTPDSSTTSKWIKSTTSPLKRRVFKVVSVMEKAIWDTPKKKVRKLFRRTGSLDISSPVGSSNSNIDTLDTTCKRGCSDLYGSFKVLVFE